MRIQWKKQVSNDPIVYLCAMQLILNDIGTGEVILILVFVLMFFGAKSIPGLARTFGRTIRQVKEASSEIQNEIRKSGSEMRNDLNLKGLIEETAEDIRRPLDQYASDLDDAVKYQPPKRPATAKPPGHAERIENEKANETEATPTPAEAPETEIPPAPSKPSEETSA